MEKYINYLSVVPNLFMEVIYLITGFLFLLSVGYIFGKDKIDFLLINSFGDGNIFVIVAISFFLGRLLKIFSDFLLSFIDFLSCFLLAIPFKSERKMLKERFIKAVKTVKGSFGLTSEKHRLRDLKTEVNGAEIHSYINNNNTVRDAYLRKGYMDLFTRQAFLICLLFTYKFFIFIIPCIILWNFNLKNRKEIKDMRIDIAECVLYEKSKKNTVDF